MSYNPFDDAHLDLDETVMGVAAYDCGESLYQRSGRSLVVCDSKESMEQWLKDHGIKFNHDLEPFTFGRMVDFMMEYEYSFLVAPEVACRFHEVLAQDQRFRLVALHPQSDGTTLIAPSFRQVEDADHDIDDLSVLHAHMDAFIIGYWPSTCDTVMDHPDGSDAHTPFTYLDYKQCEASPDDLDQWARGRLDSLSFWLEFIRLCEP